MPSRDYRLDRAKGILIFTVVLGHLLARVTPWESDLLRVPLTLIYSFHMPAFVFLAGITAKSNKLPERVLTFLILLATTLPALWGWMWIVGLDPDYDLLVPFWYTWFLLSMAWWIITVPFIERFPRTLLITSLTAGLFGGLLPLLDYELSAARSLSFWPFFVIGKLYGKTILEWAGSLRIWQKLGLSLAALSAMAIFYAKDLDKNWFYGSRTFKYFDVSAPEGIGMRLIVMIGASLMTLALLSWVGNKEGMIATIGRRSLAVYILHGFVVRGLQPVLDDSLDHFNSVVMLAVCIGLAAAATFLLSFWPFDRALRWYSSTVAKLLLKPFWPRDKHGRPGTAEVMSDKTTTAPPEAEPGRTP